MSGSFTSFKCRNRFDVAIIGGGPAGSATAIALAKAGISVALVEGPAETGWKIGESLPPVAKQALWELGIWDSFISDGHLPSYGNCSAWGTSELAYQSFVFDPNGNGWHLDRARFDKMLLSAAATEGAIRRTGTVVSCCRVVGGHWRLELLSANQRRSFIYASFVVDASGRKSWFAKRQGAKRVSYDCTLGLVALLAPRGGVTDLDSQTMVEASECGWWYSSLLPDKKLVVAYLSDGDLQLTKSARRAEGWLAILNTTEHTKARTESYESQIEIGPRMVAANSSRLRRAVGDSWLAVGDAAASYDPLSSQGIIMSVEMGLRAAETVQRYFLGDYQALEVYARSIDDMFIRYLLNMRFYYSQEARWSSYPFWRRRRFLPQTENLVEANPSLLQSSVKV